MADLSEEYLLRVEQLIQNIAVDVDAMTQKFVNGAIEGSRAVKEEITKVEKQVKRNVDNVDHFFDNLERQSIVRISLIGRAGDKMFERWDKSQREFFGEFNRHMVQARARIGMFGEAVGASGSKGIFNGAKSTLSSLWGATGGSGMFGGIIGLVLFGMKKEAEWAATGTRIARTFAQVGDVSSDAIKKSTSDYLKFQNAWMASEGELAAVAQGFADFGASAATANRQAGVEVKGFGKQVFGVSMALDNLTKAGSGTFARAIGSSMQSAGANIRSTTKEVILLTSEMRSLGTNVPKVVGQFLQMQSSMRMQRQGLDDLRRSYFALRGGLGSGVLKGTSEQHITEMAMSGMQKAQTAMSGMSEGLMAVIGEKIGGMTGIDAIIAMQQGLAGKENSQFGQVAMALGELARGSLGGTKNEQTFGLSKLLGTDIETARAILTIQEEMAANQEKGMDETKAMKEANTQLNKVFAQRAAETSPWESAMLRATQAMVKIAAGSMSLLGFIASGINVMWKMATVVAGTSMDDVKQAMMGTMSAEKALFSDRGLGQIAGGIEDIGDVAASGLSKKAGATARLPFKYTADTLRNLYKPTRSTEKDDTSFWEDDALGRTKRIASFAVDPFSGVRGALSSGVEKVIGGPDMPSISQDAYSAARASMPSTQLPKDVRRSAFAASAEAAQNALNAGLGKAGAAAMANVTVNKILRDSGVDLKVTVEAVESKREPSLVGQ